MKNVSKLLVLAMILGIPYVCRMLSGPLEPYPAILLPSAANLVERTDESFEFRRTSVYGIDRDTSEWRQLDPSEFVDPAPVHYFPSVVRNEFGLNPDGKLTARFRRDVIPSFQFDNRRWITEKKVAATRVWLRGRLTALGCKEQEFMVREVLSTADPDTKEVTELERTSEKVYCLR